MSADLDCLTSVCEMAVLRALEVAGKRARNSSRTNRELLAMPPHEQHTARCLARHPEECDRLLPAAWDHLRIVLPDQPKVITAVDWYVRQLIVTRKPHTSEDLRCVLAVACEPD
ncbi:hypothetical protein IU459_11775 [Nocardia amamiensis]|uniref:Transposase n=1 Tax=Nocardia amamiensis TaxID=404578 RepID=A0ABS0CNP4_9NOCA|nr:hypothetical protein [Nocardia amamiensis]MBF6298219.1 hypothetical protein [Nocardia amamiensis]